MFYAAYSPAKNLVCHINNLLTGGIYRLYCRWSRWHNWLAHLCGWSDRDPSQPYDPYTDYVAALDYRRKTGKGQLLDISQFEAGVNFIAPVMLDYFVNHRVADRVGNKCLYAASHNAYRCRGEDRWCTIAVFSDAEW